jgi:serine/threonine protein kinase
MRQTLRALGFMHRERYLHKDLKPQNIMMIDNESSLLKVIDFGLAELFEKGQATAAETGGTLLYMAPEVFYDQTEFKSDIWATGVILYNLLTGTFPFIGQWPPPLGKDQSWWEAETTQKIMNDAVGYPPPGQRIRHSSECDDLLRWMLTRDLRGRPTAEQCLEHAWFKKFIVEPPPLSVGITQCLEGYASQPELKKAIFLLIAQQTSVPAPEDLHATYAYFDNRNTGRIDDAKMLDVLKKTGLMSITCQSIVHSLDKDKSNDVSWTEFLAAAMCVSVNRNISLVDMAFDMIDVDRDGKLSEKDFFEFFAKPSTLPPGKAMSTEAKEERKRLEARRIEEKDIWNKYLEEQLLDLASRGGRTLSSGDSGRNLRITKEEFRKYVGESMAMTMGDGLIAAF